MQFFLLCEHVHVCVPGSINIQYVCVLEKRRELKSKSVLTPAYPSAFSMVFGNGIPWSEVQIQLLRSGHKLDFLKLGADVVSSVSFAGALKPPLAHCSFHYPYLNPLNFADQLSRTSNYLSWASALLSAAGLPPFKSTQKKKELVLGSTWNNLSLFKNGHVENITTSAFAF